MRHLLPLLMGLIFCLLSSLSYAHTSWIPHPVEHTDSPVFMLLLILLPISTLGFMMVYFLYRLLSK